ncbi:MAG: glycosyltransferase [Myxococcota bacterium]
MTPLVWITPKWPLPADDGARQATFHLLAALTAKGVSVDLHAIVPEDAVVDPDEAVAELGVRSARILRRPNPGPGLHLRNLVRDPTRALTLSQYVTREVRAALQQAAARPGVTVVFDGLHAAAWVRDAANDVAAPIVYRAHNVESDIWFRAAETRAVVASDLLRWQGRAVRRFEASLCGAADLVCTVSDSDTARLHELAPTANLLTLPIGVAAKPLRTTPPREDHILFVGRLDWPPNRDGLQWFLERVWPRVTRPLTLTIAGSGDGGWIKAHLSDPRIRFVGRVESLTPYYHESVLSLVPVFYGSGTRVKAIESSLYGTSCLGTELGVEGIGLDPDHDYLRAESEDEWVNALNGLRPSDAVARGRSALRRVMARYDRDRVADEFIRVVQERIEGQRYVA